MKIEALPTQIFRAQENLIAFLIKHIPLTFVQEGTILAVTSKLVSLEEGNFAPRKMGLSPEDERAQKKALVQKEADVFLSETKFFVQLTLKHGLLLPSAGIDESNSEADHFILYPKNPYESAKTIGLALRTHYSVKKLGIILTDSHSSPLRVGVTGIGLAHFGFKATRNLIGQKDLFGRKLKTTYVNVLDALSAAAVFEMGESNDQKPIAVISGAQGIEFTDTSSPEEIQIRPQDDLYFGILKSTH